MRQKVKYEVVQVGGLVGVFWAFFHKKMITGRLVQSRLCLVTMGSLFTVPRETLMIYLMFDQLLC